MLCRAAVLLVGMASILGLGAQDQPRLRFAVASIRPADRKSGQPSFWQTSPAGSTMTPSAADGPDVFRALKEQLGLVPSRRRAPVEMVIVTQVERPSPN